MDRKILHRFILRPFVLFVFVFCAQPYAAELSLRIPESAINSSISALTDADALGIAGYSNAWGVNKWWFQIDDATVNLMSGGGVDISAVASAKGNINIADVISFSASGNGTATLHGQLLLGDVTTDGRPMNYNLNSLSGVSVHTSSFPGFIDSFLGDVIERYFVVFGPLDVSPGAFVLPSIPDNAVVSAVPDVVVTDDALFLNLAVKRVLPDLTITNFSHTKVGDGYVYIFNATVQNMGDAVAQRDFKISLYDGNPDSNDDHIVDQPLPESVAMLGQSQVVGVLDKDASESVSWQVALNNGIDHDIYAVVDGTNTVFESHEENNVKITTVHYVKGDLDGNLCVDQRDLNIIIAAVRRGTSDTSFDLNGDGVVNIADARRLVTYFEYPRGALCT